MFSQHWFNISPHIPVAKRALLILILTCLHSGLSAQSPPTKPFVQYNERDSLYLNRIHKAGRGPLDSSRLTRTKWERWQRLGREKLQELLGLQQIAKDCKGHTPTVALGERIPEDGYTRRLGVIETEPGIKIPFWLLEPTGLSVHPRPIAICAQGHGGNSWNNYAGIYNSQSEEDRAHSRNATPGLEAVKRGFTTIVPAIRGLATAASIADPKGRHGDQLCRAQLVHALLAGRTAIGERVWDCQRLLDWAQDSLVGVDTRKVLFTGNSGGGVLTVYMAALDPRIKVAVPSCSFTSYTSATGYIFHCDCCLVPRVQVELGDFTDIGALIAPRHLMSVHGRQDSLHHFSDVELAMERVARVYRKLGHAERFSHQWGDQGHQFYPELMWRFIEQAIGTIEN